MYNAPSIDIATMPIADKVHRYANAKYYKALLDALQAAANEVGCDFALSSRDAAYIPEDIYEHLAFNLVLAREQYLRPAIGSIAHYENAESCMKDGYAHLLLRDVLSALSELGLKWRIRSIEYYDREGLQRAQARRTNGGFPPLPEPAASAPSIKADVSRLADEFFNGLDTPKPSARQPSLIALPT